MNAIEISSLKKVFGDRHGGTWALKGIDLNIRKNGIFGLLGPNGAGKTTLIYILSTLLLPTSGRVRVMGHDAVEEAEVVRQIVGLCMGGTQFYDDLRPREILEFYGRLYGIPRAAREKRIDGLVSRLRIDEFGNKNFYDLSTGMKQKVAVAKSLINEPQVLFLDEPTSGLDVEASADVRNFIEDLVRERSMTVILTSHYLQEVEDMCDRIAIINRGRLVTEGGIDAIRKRMKFPDVMHFYLDRYDGLDFLGKMKGVTGFSVGDGLWVRVDSGLGMFDVLTSAFARRKIRVIDVELRKASLEDVFLGILGGRGRRAGGAADA